MLFSLLITSVSAGPPNKPSLGPMPISVTNSCVDGTVDGEFMVTLKPPPPDSNGRRLLLGTQDLLGYLQGWAHQYDPEDTSNGATRPSLTSHSRSATRLSRCMSWLTRTIAPE